MTSPVDLTPSQFFQALDHDNVFVFVGVCEQMYAGGAEYTFQEAMEHAYDLMRQTGYFSKPR